MNFDLLGRLLGPNWREVTVGSEVVTFDYFQAPDPRPLLRLELRPGGCCISTVQFRPDGSLLPNYQAHHESSELWPDFDKVQPARGLILACKVQLDCVNKNPRPALLAEHVKFHAAMLVLTPDQLAQAQARADQLEAGMRAILRALPAPIAPVFSATTLHERVILELTVADNLELVERLVERLWYKHLNAKPYRIAPPGPAIGFTHQQLNFIKEHGTRSMLDTAETRVLECSNLLLRNRWLQETSTLTYPNL
jgi:hypothetical protein